MFIVERIEGDTAILETDSGKERLALSELPPGVREGDVLQKGKEGWLPDPSLTALRREEARQRTRALFKRRPQVPPKEEN